ncbi:MAG: hypothetical protein HRU00_00125, partial [Myxococcales bacterium]|nr:hypothetical protein [Myxococcales bacterium]
MGVPGNAPIAPTGNFDDVTHAIAPEFGHFDDMLAPEFRAQALADGFGTSHGVEYGLYIEETMHQFVPNGPETAIFAYRDIMKDPGSGTTPGPTVVVPYRKPAVLRCFNALTADRGNGDGQVNTTDHAHESSIHLHGGHNTAHA